MRQQITADLRWEQYCNTQAGEAVLKQMFEQNIEMFDSSMVRARHILLKGGDATTARAKLTDMKRQIETAAAAALAKLPADADAATRAAARAKAVDDTFAEVAREHSDCPSKKEGGDLNYFPRSGSMVEPFAQAAFSLKLFEISDPVATPFGYHLILATARKAGMPVKFDDVRDAVFSVYTVRLRDSLLAQLRPMAKISIPPVKSTP
jgi:parvulin-like peptidyl-prolyl isomerase